MRMRLAKYVKDESGQMAVELAIILPVIIIAMVIIIDGVVFVSECARFDHIANNAVLSGGVSMQGTQFNQDDATASVKKTLQDSFSFSSEKVSVSANAEGLLGDLINYECTLKVAPWPLNAQGITVFGAHVPTSLTHTRSFVVRPYAPGRL